MICFIMMIFTVVSTCDETYYWNFSFGPLTFFSTYVYRRGGTAPQRRELRSIDGGGTAPQRRELRSIDGGGTAPQRRELRSIGGG
jgi:hypothetical protein